MSDSSGWGSPDPHQPQQPPQQPVGWQQPTSWTGPTGPTDPGWSVATPKPGVIPLRPLGVGEILDGAITTIRKNPAATLGLSAAVAIVTQLIGLALTLLVIGRVAAPVFSDQLVLTTDEAGELVATILAAALIAGLVSWLASTILSGILTVVVGRAVLGERIGIGAAWAATRPRILALLGLSLLVGLIVAAPVLAVLILSLGVAAGAGDSGFALLSLLLLALPISVWLLVRFSLASASLMLETTDGGPAGPQRMSVTGSMQRSAALVRTSWWRVFGIILVAAIIGTIINAVFTVPFDAIAEGIGWDSFAAGFVSTLGAIVAATISVPFVAAVTVLLYVDRRIRAEGLDIELANAAGVQIPGRTDPGPGYGQPGAPGWGPTGP